MHGSIDKFQQSDSSTAHGRKAPADFYSLQLQLGMKHILLKVTTC